MTEQPPSRAHWSVRTFLIWLVLACLLPGVIGAIALFVHEYRESRARQERDMISTARALVQAVDSHLLRGQALAQALATTDALTTHDLARFYRGAQETMQRAGLGTNIVLRDEAGRQILNTAIAFGQPLSSRAAPEQVRAVFTTGKPTVSNLFIGPVLKRPVMSVDVPVILNGKVAYALGVGIPPEHFNAILTAQNLPPGWIAAVLDSTGTIVGRNQSPEQFVGKQATDKLLRSMLQFPEGAVEAISQEGDPVTSYYSRSPVTGWRVALGIPRQNLQEALVRPISMLGFGVASLFGIGLLLAWFMGGRIAHSVKALTDPATALGNGSAAPMPKVHIQEAADVALAIGRAAALLQERASSLQAREAELAESHRLAKFGNWHWNLVTGEVTSSASIREMYGREVPPFPLQRGTLLSVESWERVQAAAQQAIQTGKGYDLELQVNHGDGRTIWISAKCEAMRNQDNQVIALHGATQDITERKHAEQALQESEAKFRTIANAMPQMVWSTRPDGYHDYFNQQWYDYTGAPEGTTDGDGWNAMFHADDQPEARARWRQCLATGQTYEIEYRLRHHSGAYRWVLGRALPVRDESGQIIRWMGTCTDIHAQKQAEEELMAASHRKDEFLAMLAHELRNPLAPISTAAQILKMPGVDQQRIYQSSDIIGRQVKHMTILINDLLDVSRVTRGLVSLEKKDIDLKTILPGAIEQAQPLIEEKQHQLLLQLAPGPAWVQGDRTRLVQVVANLLTNAAKYTPRHGKIVLALEVRQSEVMICVSDNGTGIEPSLLSTIFDLFTQGERTLARSQGGLGLGLALVKNIVTLHGGRVEARSDGPGQGSRFAIALPRFDAAASQAVPPQDAAHNHT